MWKLRSSPAADGLLASGVSGGRQRSSCSRTLVRQIWWTRRRRRRRRRTALDHRMLLLTARHHRRLDGTPHWGTEGPMAAPLVVGRVRSGSWPAYGPEAAPYSVQ